MRTLLYGAACSLDGFIAAPNDEVDWLQWSDDVAAISKTVWDRVDTVLMGRKTYDVAVRMGTRAYPGVNNYVFSRTLAPEAAPEVTVVADDAVAYVRKMKQQPGSGICLLGGGELARSLMDADLVDEVGVNIQPVLLGSGIPLLPASTRKHSLKRVESRRIAGDCVYILYRVEH
jgi:dihydrofolate reductase